MSVTGIVAASALAFTPIEVDGLFIDGFAGGGGASTGIEQAIGRGVDIAITAGGAHQNVVGATLAPFVTYGQHGGHSRPADEPHHTVAASAKDTNGVACAAMAPLIDRQFGKSATGRADEPIGATTAGGSGKSAAVTAFLSSMYTSNTNGGRGRPDMPLKTILAGANHHGVVCAHMEQANTGRVGHPMPKPLSTVTSTGGHQRLVETTLIEEGDLPPALMESATKVAGFLVKYYATDGENEAAQSQAADRPLDCITTKARFAVVTVTIEAKTYVIVDIGLRMLKPRELARAQGFPETYVLDPECWYVTKSGKRKFGRLPLAYQISAIGNSVCPPVARALVAANQPCDARRMAA